MIINRLLKCTLYVDKLLGIKSVDFDIDHLQIMYLHSSDTGNELGYVSNLYGFKKTYNHLLGGKFCIIFS